MAPWPEQGNEPKAPDKSCNKSGENSSLEASKVSVGNTEDLEVNATAAKCDDKQADDHNAHVSNLDDGQLRALLDEAIAYKCPKDREGKSNLFIELLQEAEANEDGDSRRGLAGVGGSRYYSNSNRRRGRRDAHVSERQTRGGSLQNLVHASNTEFDPAAGFGGYHSGSSRTARKSKRLSTGSGSYGSGSVGSSGSGRDCGGISVSARQREGGSLPSNVNVGGMLTLSGLDYHTTPTSLPFDDIKSCKQVAARRKEFIHSSSSNEFMSMPVQASTINSSGSNSGGVESGSAVVSNNSTCLAPKSEFMVLDLGDYVENTGESKGGNNSSVNLSNNVTSTSSGNTDNCHGSASQSEEKKNLGDNNGTEEEGLELEVLQRAEVTTHVPNYTSRARLEVGHSETKKSSPNLSASGASEIGEVDTTVPFPLEILQCREKTPSSVAVNGVEQSSLQLQSSYTSVKSIMSSSSSTSGPRDNQSSIAKDVNRLTFTHGGSKDCSGESKNKSLDENGNAVNRLESANSNSTERKVKQRKTKTNNDRNVIMSQNIEGYRGDKDIDTVLKFIESNSDGKGANKTKNSTSHSNGPVNFNSKQQRNCSRLIGCGTKPRRERGAEDPSDEDRIGKGRTGSGKQVTKEHRGKNSKLKKSNSLEEISKTKLEDLTSNSKEGSENGVSGASGNNGNSEEGSSVFVRRPKKQSTLDNGEFYGEKGRVGDRRSWGTEEGQQYYCNDGVTVSADEGSSGSGQNSRKRRGNATVLSSLTSDEKRKSDREEGASVASLSAGGSGASEETDFHVVTKRQRRKKRRSSSGGRGTSVSTGGCIFGDDGWRPYPNCGSSYYPNRDGGGGSYYQRKTFTNTSTGFPPHDRTVERDSGGVMLLSQYRHYRPRSPDHLRRKSTSSMPPSDKSDSSDLDSVHSLPVSSTTPKSTFDQMSTSSGSTPQASYADITRMASTNVPSAPTHPHNYVNINLNANRWPVMGVPKNAVASNTAGSASTCTTVTTVSIPTSSTSVVTSSVASSNPQIISGPNIGATLKFIGVPPVSGSKVAVISVSNSASGFQSVNQTTVPVASAASEELYLALTRKEFDASNCSSAEQVLTSKVRSTNSPPTDVRTKKDAMTNTSLDYTVPPCESEEKETVPTQNSSSVRPTESAVNFLRDGEYPSLEESLSSDKLKSMKISQVHSTHSQFLENSLLLTSFVNISIKDKAESSTVVTVSESEKDSVVFDKRLQTLPVESNIGTVIAAAAATAAVVATTTNSSCTVTTTPTSVTSPQTCVPDSVIVNTGVSGVQNADVLSDVAKSKDTNLFKSKNASKKSSSSGSRPPVIIMDENDQVFPYSDGLTTVSELTFGFEVNEQLLMSDTAEMDGKAVSSVHVHVLDSSSVIVEEAIPTISSAALPPVSAYCSPGEDFSARYREPLTQPDNHDKIVTYVGSAWDDVLKEMNCAPVHSGCKVQYYSGQ